jgi:tRNA-dihydrouridine synthase A
VHRLKQERPALTIELNGGLQTLQECRDELAHVDGVMVGRAVYDHPLRWAGVDAEIFGEGQRPAVLPTRVVRGMAGHAERWCADGGHLWPTARPLMKLVEGVSGARRWRALLSRAAAARGAGPEVLWEAASQLEQAGL